MDYELFSAIFLLFNLLCAFSSHSLAFRVCAVWAVWVCVPFSRIWEMFNPFTRFPPSNVSLTFHHVHFFSSALSFVLFLFCPFHFFLRYKFFNVPCMNWFLPPVYTRISFFISYLFIFSTPFSIFIIFGHPLWWIFHSVPIYMKINEREEIKMGESASILAIYAERARAYS